MFGDEKKAHLTACPLPVKSILHLRLVMLLLTNHPEAHIGVSLVCFAGIVRIFRAAGVAWGVPTAALYDILSCSVLRGGPLPAVTPEVDAPAVAYRL